jgi:acyl carrier protein
MLGNHWSWMEDDMPKLPATGQIETIIHDKIHTLLRERSSDLRTLHGSDNLNSALGLSSLDLATLVAQLEAELGFDPFTKSVAITSIRTVDDLVRAYRGALAGPAVPDTASQLRATAVQRANARRARRK